MSDALRTSFALPDEYVEQTRSLRDRTAQELGEVRARIADLQIDEARLVAQLAAMDNIVDSVASMGCNSKQSDGSAVGSYTESSSVELAEGPERTQNLVQLPAARLLESVPTSAGQLGDETLIETPEAPVGSPESLGYRSSRHSPGLARSVDAVVKTLAEHGPLHYRSIYENVEAMGISVIGKDPAAVLLSRFSRDPRIRRVGSGTYDLSD